MDGYSVLVETRAPEGAAPLHPAEDLADGLMGALEPYHPSVSAGSSSWSARITVDDQTPRGACTQALAVVADARKKVGLPDWPVVEVRVIREDVLAEELARPVYPDIIDATEAAEILDVTRQRVHQLLRDHSDFPRPLYHLRIGPLWLRASVEAFDRRWERKPGRPRKTA